jgi:hypothetical protein
MKTPAIVKVFPTTDATEVPEFHWHHKVTMYHNIRAALNLTSYWSIDEVTNFTEVAFKGYIGSLHYGYHNGVSIDVLVDKHDPDWFDIYKAADEAIMKSREHGNHHLYIEIINRGGEGASSLYLFTGS